jgi:hypothetical protein
MCGWSQSDCDEKIPIMDSLDKVSQGGQFGFGGDNLSDPSSGNWDASRPVPLFPVLGHTIGEQNIVCRTTMYVQNAQRQGTKGVWGFLEGQTGLDKVGYGGLRGSHPSTSRHPRKAKRNQTPRRMQSGIRFETWNVGTRHPGPKPPLLTVLAGHFSKSVRSGAPPVIMGRGSEAHPP